MNSKLPEIGTSIFAVMSQLAADNNALNLSQGFPDFDVSPELIELVNDYMIKGYNQYAPYTGVSKLRKMISSKTKNLHDYLYDADKEINITAGATQAIYTIITSFIKQGDEVLIFEPAYDSYGPSVLLNGGIPVYSELKFPDYSINWNEVEQKITSKTRMIIINSPHNPTGSVLKCDDLKMLEKITKDKDIIILSDEVYEHLIFEGKQHKSVSRYPELAKKSFVIGSFGKTFHVTGWKIGYCLAPEHLMKEFRKAHQFIVFTCNNAVQNALADFLENPDNYNNLGSFYQKKRDLFVELIEKSRFKIVPSYGTYFQLLDYSDISDKKDIDFARKLTEENKIASIPVSVFNSKGTDNKVLRFCFAKKDETIIKASEILCKI